MHMQKSHNKKHNTTSYNLMKLQILINIPFNFAADEEALGKIGRATSEKTAKLTHLNPQKILFKQGSTQMNKYKDAYLYMYDIYTPYRSSIHTCFICPLLS